MQMKISTHDANIMYADKSINIQSGERGFIWHETIAGFISSRLHLNL